MNPPAPVSHHEKVFPVTKSIPTLDDFQQKVIETELIHELPQQVSSYLEAGFLSRKLNEDEAESIGWVIKDALDKIPGMEPAQIEAFKDALCLMIQHVKTDFQWPLPLVVIYGSGVPHGSLAKIITAAINSRAFFVQADLCLTVHNDDTEATNALLDARVIDFTIRDRFNPLETAINGRKGLQTIQKLLAAGAHVTERVISLAEQSQQTEVVDMLKNHKQTQPRQHPLTISLI